MRIILSVEKDSTNYDEVNQIIAESGFQVSEILTGGSRNDSSFGRRWAREHNVPVKLFKPNKNEQMTDCADGLIAIWRNAEGEMKDMLSRASKKSLKIFITRV